MIISFQKMKATPLWAKCLIGSLALHSAFLYVAFEHPILMKKSWAFFSSSKPLPKYIKIDESWNPETLTLQHFFEEFPLPIKKLSLSSSLEIRLQEMPLEETGEPIAVTLPSSFFLKEKSFTPSQILLSSFANMESETVDLVKGGVAFPSLSKVDYVGPVLHSLSPSETIINKPLKVHFVPPVKTTSPLAERVHYESFEETSKAALQDRQGTFQNSPDSSFVKGDEYFASLDRFPIHHVSTDAPFDLLAEGSFADVNDYLPQELISALEWNDDFEIKSTLFPDQGGYVFSLAVTPKQDFRKQRMKQNFYFLIDISSDIENHKLAVFKRSVLKALGSLQQGDAFNIFLLDKGLKALNPSNLFVSPKTMEMAEDFLEKKGNERSFFSSLNLNGNLNELVKYLEADDEVNTAILLTNGKSTVAPKELRQFLSKHKGKFNLFTAAVGQNNQLTFLDMVSSCFGGSLFYSDTNASFPRKLALFIKNLESPLAKNLTLSIQPSHPKASLELCSGIGQMPNLYNKEPFIIMGKMDRLCDLHLVLQGKSAEDQIFLKKVIHFEEATPPESSVKKQWQLQQKTALYEKFLKEAKPSYLKSAKEILKTVHGKAFGE